MDGFVPGEGAAFVLLGKKAPAGQPAVRIRGVAQGFEAGHLYSDEPYKGDGLAGIVTTLFENMPDGPKIQSVLAGFNGENFNAKEWGVTALRNAGHLEEPIRLEHPVDCIGDPGAALGPLLVILAAIGLQKGYLNGPCLAWCSSDYGSRAAVVIDNK
jgi:3-oxoacyl-[acyl-carrier-protein] synthase-1